VVLRRGAGAGVGAGAGAALLRLRFLEARRDRKSWKIMENHGKSHGKSHEIRE
jgi:hypothetical protein